MQTKDTVINRIITELDELKTKLINLETFLTSPDFMKITPNQKKLLEEQYDVMQKYKTVLIKRVYNLRWEMAQEKDQETAPENIAMVGPTVEKKGCFNCRNKASSLCCICIDGDKWEKSAESPKE